MEYKKNNPEKIVLIWYVDEEPWQHQQAIEDFKTITNSSLTIIHMLNYFSNLKLNLQSTEYAIDICEMLKNNKEFTFLARGSFANIGAVNETKSFIKKAIHHQLKNNGLSFLELIFPCHWRLEKCPSEIITSAQVAENIKWFNERILFQYKTGVFKENE